ncbi:MAG: hypothetical protein WCL38_03475, partial [Actinomycetota bacterium]
MTLVELLVVIIIMPLVLGAAAVGLMSMFQTERHVGQIMDAASKAQIAASQLSTDLKGASAATQNRTPSCGPNAVTLMVNGVAVSEPIVQQVAPMS